MPYEDPVEATAPIAARAEERMHSMFIMRKALIAFLVPGAYGGVLSNADHALELARNEQLRASDVERRHEHRRRTEIMVLDRLRLLRTRTWTAFIFIASAVVLGIVVSWLVPKAGSTLLPTVLAIVSISLFAWATLGRLGWAGQSFGGDTVVERLDQVLFWALYWLGTFTGVLAIIW
jgi:hypothetical protein